MPDKMAPQGRIVPERTLTSTALAILTAPCIAAVFIVLQFYTSLDRLSPTPPVGYVIVPRAGALAMVAVLAVGVLLLTARCVSDRATAPSWPILALWTGAAGVSAMLGFDPISGLQMVAMLALVAAFHIALVRYYAEPGVASATVISFLCVGIVASLAGVAMNVLHKPAELYALNHARAAGLFVTPNQFAAYLLTLLAVAFGVAVAARSASLRALAWVAFACGVLALAASFSRGGWLSFGIGATFFAFASRRARAGWLMVALIASGITFGILHADAYHEPADAFVRVGAWEAGLRAFERFPLTGVGPMAYWHVYPALKAPDGEAIGTFAALHPHSLFISLAAEMGLVGLGAIGWGWWLFLRLVKTRLRDAGPRRRAATVALAAGLVATFVHGLVDTIGIVEMTFVWVPFTALTLAVALHGLAPVRSRDDPGDQTSRAENEVA